MKIRLAPLIAVLAACLTTTLTTSAYSASPPDAAASSTVPPRVTDHGTGWTVVRDPAAHLLREVRAGFSEVLHIDTEHATDDGFWWAERDIDVKRGFVWRYQPYGLRCEAPASEVVFNPWTNFFSCLVDAEKVDAVQPEYAAVTASGECRSARPWSFGYAQAGVPTCDDTGLQPGSAGLVSAPGFGAICAPWEQDQIAASHGDMSRCNVRYDWDRSPAGLGWLPAPDECTGAPADLQAGPFRESTATDNPSCDGSALAPNCTGATAEHPACGAPLPAGVKVGWPENSPNVDGHTAIVRVDATGQTASGRAKVTVTRTVTYPSRRVEVTVTRRVAGRVFTATRTATSKRVSVTMERTESADWREAGLPTIAVASCSAPDPTEATECATARATERAMAESTDLARARGEGEARRVAMDLAESRASGHARLLADWAREAAVNVAKVTATKRAQRALGVMVRRYLAAASGAPRKQTRDDGAP